MEYCTKCLEMSCLTGGAYQRVLLLLLLLSRFRLCHPWDSPGKNTGVDRHFLLQCMKVKRENEVTQSCPTLLNPMDWRPPGSSIHGIFQARVLEWVAIAFSRGSSWPRDQTWVFHTVARYFTIWATRKETSHRSYLNLVEDYRRLCIP